jgi:hypothetical protein
MVTVGDFVRLGEHGRAAFHVDEPHWAVKLEFQFEWVEQLHRGQVVVTKAKMLETATKFLRVGEEVGDHDHQRPLANFLRQFVQQPHEVRAAGRLSAFQQIEEIR